MNTKDAAEDQAYEVAKQKGREQDHAPVIKTYLGDGAYAEVDRYGDLVLTTEDGISVQNRVVLGPHEWTLLRRFMEEQGGRR